MSEHVIPEPVAEGVGPALGGKGAPCPEITFCGVNWKVGWPTQEAKLWHELLVAKHAEDEELAMAKVRTPEELAGRLRRLEMDVRAGQHRVFGAIWSATVDGPDGMPLFLLSLLKEHHPKATFADAKVLWGACTREVRSALAQVIPPFAAILIESAPLDREEKPAKARELAAALLERVGVTPKPSAGPTG